MYMYIYIYIYIHIYIHIYIYIKMALSLPTHHLQCQHWLNIYNHVWTSFWHTELHTNMCYIHIHSHVYMSVYIHLECGSIINESPAPTTLQHFLDTHSYTQIFILYVNIYMHSQLHLDYHFSFLKSQSMI